MEEASPPRRCRTCGTSLLEGATWCSTCYRRSFHENNGELAEELIRAFEDRTHYRYQPRPDLVEPRPASVHSRWRGGPTSFGPIGKIAITIPVVGLLFGPAVYVLVAIAIGRLPVVQNAYPFFMVMATIGFLVGGFILRELWRSKRVA